MSATPASMPPAAATAAFGAVGTAGAVGAATGDAAAVRPVDWRRCLQLALATIWLLDGVLQLQTFMFTPGANGFSGMLSSMASGNPGWIARSITWNASLVDHHPAPTNAAFAAIQILIGLGIAWRPATRAALGGSIAWSLGVWWFGEGLGAILSGNGTPLAGGPGAVLVYAMLAVLLWPAPVGAAGFAAGQAIGERAAKVTWTAFWALMAVLSVFGSARSPRGVQGVIQTVDSGQPGWLATIDRHAASVAGDHGLAISIVLAVAFVIIAGAVYMPRTLWRSVLVVTVALSAAIWVVCENFGMILAGGATDPNSGPLLILLALSFWPVTGVTRASQLAKGA